MKHQDLIASAQPLAAIFDEKAELRRPVAGFLKGLIEENPETFWGLFKGSRNAAEMEVIVHQTICGMLETGLPYNRLALKPDSGYGLVNNSDALNNLKKEGYVLVSEEGDKITLTDKMLGKLLSHSRNSSQSTSLLQAPRQSKLLSP